MADRNRSRTPPKAAKGAPKGRKAAPKGGASRSSRAARETPVQQPSLVPYLAVEDAARAIAWYKEAFGAREATRQAAPGGKVLHAELRIGDARFYLSDVFPGADVEHPTSLGGTTTSLHLSTPDVDRAWARAVSAGGVVTMPLANQFWGDRYGKLRDPFGHSWSLSWPAQMTEAERTRLQEAALKSFAAAGDRPA
jgi:uncharacterized glyoxalase superfamily protein PhnB